MSMVHLLFHQDGPVAAFGSTREAMKAIHELPTWADPDLFLLAVPFEPGLKVEGGTVLAAPEAGERRVSDAAGSGRVTLSPNGNKVP